MMYGGGGRMAVIAAIVVAIVGPVRADGTACPIASVPLSKAGGSAGTVSVLLSGGSVLGDPNGPNRAKVWEDPIRLRQSNGAICAVDPDVSIVTEPMFNAGDRVLYVTAYSGSQSRLFAVGLSDCKVLWKSPAFARGPSLAGQTFSASGTPVATIGADCRPLPIKANPNKAP